MDTFVTSPNTFTFLLIVPGSGKKHEINVFKPSIKLCQCTLQIYVETHRNLTIFSLETKGLRRRVDKT